MKRITSLILLLIILFPLAALTEGHNEEYKVDDPVGFFSQDLSYDAFITVPTGRTFAYYSQKDPLYALWYEDRSSKRRRQFSWGGCCPTAAAMALRCVTEDEEITLLEDVLKTPLSFCVCSINKYQCEDGHTRYTPSGTEEYLKLLPVIIGEIACGNNTDGVVARNSTGTGTGFLKVIIRPFGIRTRSTNSWTEAAQAVEDGKGVMCLAQSGSPFTTVGHWMLYAGCDDEYEYFLDPMTRDEYTNDKGKVIKVLHQGLVCVEKSKRNRTQISQFIILEKDPAPAGK